MGCFDSVWVPCPQCGTRSEFQSKGGECILVDYELENAPPDVLSDVNRHAPNKCYRCGCVFYVKVNTWEEKCSSCGHTETKATGKAVKH